MTFTIDWGKPVFRLKQGDQPASLPPRPSVAVDPVEGEPGEKTWLPFIDIATDSEWHSDGSWLSTSFAVNVGGQLRCFHFVDRRLPEKTLEVWAQKAEKLGDTLFYWDAEREEARLETVIRAIKSEFPWIGRSRVNLLMFFSPKDLEFAHGWERMEPLYRKSKRGVDQKRNIRGSFYCAGLKITIRDLQGWTTGGLGKFAESVAVDTGDKGVMDEYKTRMRDGFIEHPDIAFDYSRNDVLLLHHIQDKFERQIKAIASQTLKIPPILRSRLKGTTGSMTATIFQEWLHAQFLTAEGWKGFNVACNKLGLLSRDVDEKVRQRFNQDPGALEITDFEFMAYSQCSVGYLARFAAMGDSTAFNCLVQGGRCNNERPGEYFLDDGADIDLSSCYGTALKEFTYPIGLPTLWGYQNEQLRPTLGEFLKDHKNELVPGLWTITVTGELKFPQDLIFSKIVELSAIASASGGGFDKEFGDDDRDDDVAHIPGDFALLRREIVNGIITHDILQAVRTSGQQSGAFPDYEPSGCLRGGLPKERSV